MLLLVKVKVFIYVCWLSISGEQRVFLWNTPASDSDLLMYRLSLSAVSLAGAYAVITAGWALTSAVLVYGVRAHPTGMVGQVVKRFVVSPLSSLVCSTIRQLCTPVCDHRSSVYLWAISSHRLSYAVTRLPTTWLLVRWFSISLNKEHTENIFGDFSLSLLTRTPSKQL